MSITTPALTFLKDSSKITPMLLIEVPTTLGRTYQGYKRGGKTEGRERIFEETFGAAVWLFGIKTFNKIGDIFGEKVLGLKDLGTDVGRDSLRNPFGYVKDKKMATAIFKFSKIFASVALGTAAMGIFVPKVKVAMSNAIRKHDGLEPYPDKNDVNGVHKDNWADKLVGLFIKGDNRKKLNPNTTLNMQDFISSAKKSGEPSFKGASGALNGILYASHNLENNTAWRLLSTDAGTLAGRVMNSRTKKEKIEYLTRDSISSLFYIFAAPLFSKGVSKATKTPNIHPKAANVAGEYFKSLVKDKSAPADLFSSGILSNGQADKLVSGINFRDDGTILLSEFNKQTKNAFADKAMLMSKLQPKYIDDNGVASSILSKKQVVDVMSNGDVTDPKFLKKAISAATGGKSDDIKAFVSRKKLEGIRDSIDDFAKGLEKYALKKAPDGRIDAALIDKYTKNLNRKNLLIHLSGIGFAVFGLAFLIPKFQYFVSEKLTGEKEFLGSFNSDKNNETK